MTRVAGNVATMHQNILDDSKDVLSDELYYRIAGEPMNMKGKLGHWTVPYQVNGTRHIQYPWKSKAKEEVEQKLKANIITRVKLPGTGRFS